jgi:hypothetical membrane protein
MGTTTKEVRGAVIPLKTLLAAGGIGPILFIVVFLIEGATREGYNPLRHPVSSLSIGEFGWIQALNFLMVGASFIAFAFGLHRATAGGKKMDWGAWLIGLAGLGLFGAGIFTSDPVFGYPQSAPLVLAQFTTHGHLHDLFSILLFLGLPTANFVFTYRFARKGVWGWAVYSILTGIGMLVTFVLAGKGFLQSPGYVEIAGVYQRLSIAIGMVWIALLAWRLMRQGEPTAK